MVKVESKTRDIAAEAKIIDEAVKGLTMIDALREAAELYGSVEALRWRVGDEWNVLTWAEYAEQVEVAANGFASIGLKPGEFVNILSANRYEYLIADYGIVHAGGVPVSLYNSFSPEQIEYIVNHCEAAYVLVENRDFYEKLLKIRDQIPNVRKVVMFDGAEEFATDDWVIGFDVVMESGRNHAKTNSDEIPKRRKGVKPESLATLIYTSGTTGPPKGVMVSHHNLMWTTESTRTVHKTQPGSRIISYLPLAHIAERMMGHYLATREVWTISFCPDPRQIGTYLGLVRPNIFFAVPRVLEKIHSGILAAVAANPDADRKKMATDAIEAKIKIVELTQEGQEIPADLKEIGDLADALVLPPLRQLIGLDDLTLVSTGAAPISKDVLNFFAAIGVHVAEVYGQSEDTGPTSWNPPSKIKIGTVGPSLPGVEVKLLDDGELLVRGGNVTQGYYKEPEQTAETFDSDGWLHSGDVAVVDEDGYIKIVDRKKEIIITAGGKNIAPSNVESLIKQCPIIGQCAVIGDTRPYLVALVVLDSEVALPWAKANGLPEDLPSLAASEKVRETIQAHLDEISKKLHGQEQVKKFVVLPTEWTPESEELTPTLKLKRRVVNTKYADEINSMYA